MSSSGTLAGIARLMPWTERNGRVSVLRAVVLVLLAAPAAWMAVKWNMGWLSPKPLTDILRECGNWTMRLIVVVLAISPLRDAARWNRIIAVRRMIGVAAMCYALAHLFFYFVDQNFVWLRIAGEILVRVYLTIGFFALLVLIALGATSNDAMVRKLGSVRWNRLHLLVHAAALAAVVHFFMQVRLKAYEPSLMAGLLTLLAGYRILRKRGHATFVRLIGLALAGGVLSALIEAGYYAFATGASARMILESTFDFSYEVRPAWYVLAAGLAIALIKGVRDLVHASRGRPSGARAPRGDVAAKAPAGASAEA